MKIILLLAAVHAFGNIQGEKQMENKRVLISGAGIGGLSAAYFLKQYGFTPTIVEKHPTLRTGGYKIDVRGSAIEVVKKMGIHDAIFARRTDIREAHFIGKDGTVEAQTDGDLGGVRNKGDLEIVRGDLCEILLQNAGDVEIIYGDKIANISGKKVTFQSGNEGEFDLIIGADGLHSPLRKMIWNDEENIFHEMGSYISIFSIPNYLNLDRVELEHLVDGTFVMAYCPSDGNAKAGFAFGATSLEGDLRKTEVQKQILREKFANHGWEVPKLLQLMDKSPDFYFDCMAQVRMPNFTKGPVALVGDSGYCASPMSGQGSSLALIGAYILAGELAKAEGDFNTAYPVYEEKMRDFIAKNQEIAQLSASVLEGDNSLVEEISPEGDIEAIRIHMANTMERVSNSIIIEEYATSASL
jgi:2-polyprenyl-6-methoxyphenol hydroxylase-like FAD-dependent oxidoreductase